MPERSMPSTAFMTASYGPDLERCRLLCETMDARATGWSRHYILVSGRDRNLFAGLAGPRREIVDERDLLPSWLVRMPDPSSGFRRDLWLHPWGKPLRGWHVQQLRRMALAAHVAEDALVSVDSDVAFVTPYDAGDEWREGRLRLYRVPDALDDPGLHEQRLWSAHAARLLGLPAGAGRHDYINTLVPWRRDAARAMMAAISDETGMPAMRALAAIRTISECMIYGRFVEDVQGLDGHWPDPRAFCKVLWRRPGSDFEGLDAFINNRAPHQVAVGLQSFIGLPVADIRQLVLAR